MLGLVLWLILHASPTWVPAPANPENDTVILASYAYDALGRRVSTTIGDQTTHCVFDGQNVIAEYSPAGQLLREHFHGAQYIDERIATHEINTAEGRKGDESNIQLIGLIPFSAHPLFCPRRRPKRPEYRCSYYSAAKEPCNHSTQPAQQQGEPPKDHVFQTVP